MHPRPSRPIAEPTPAFLADAVGTAETSDTADSGTGDTPHMPRHTPEASPVFVDTSGRRQRRVRRWGRLLVIPAAAYVVLLISTLVGGPTVPAPFLPSAQAPQNPEHKVPAVRTTPSSTIGKPASGSLSPRPSATRATASATAAPGRTAGPATGGTVPTSATGGGTLPTPAPTARGRSGSAPGQGGGKPTAHP